MKKILLSLILVALFLVIPSKAHAYGYQSTITEVGAVSAYSYSTGAPSYSFGSTSSMLGAPSRGRMLTNESNWWDAEEETEEDPDPEFWDNPGELGAPIGDIPYIWLFILTLVYVLVREDKRQKKSN